uniref:Ankyrin repeat protein n=1 Tax=Pithovirus LCPAC304 TaxID=2506594 RepID=A0A481Z8J0_9VIRU|nr:MAG: ankyrin repeat protein [Pithovirus LCPAC304]
MSFDLCEELIRATKKGWLNEMERLLECGADVNGQSEKDETPLLKACEGFDNIHIVRYLLDNGADVNHKRVAQIASSYYETALSVCLEYSDVTTAQLLVDHGANVDEIVDEKSKTILLFVMEYVYSHIHNDKGTLRSIEFLVKNGADVNATDEQGCSPLSQSVLAGNFDLVQLFVENGADLDSKDEDGDTALDCACSNNDFKIATYLLHHGATNTAKIDTSPIPEPTMEEKYLYLLYWFQKTDDDVKEAILYQHLRSSLPDLVRGGSKK